MLRESDDAVRTCDDIHYLMGWYSLNKFFHPITLLPITRTCAAWIYGKRVD